MITIKLTDAQVSALECREDGGFDEGCQLRWAWMSSQRRALCFASAEHVNLAADAALNYANEEDGQWEQCHKSNPEAARGARGACLALTNLAHKLRKEAQKHV